MLYNLEGPLSIETYGPWKKELQKLAKLGDVTRDGTLIGQRKAGERLVKIVKGHIRNQDLGLKALSSRYLKNKLKRHQNPGVLISTGAYLEAIDTWRENYVYYVGVRRGKLDSDAYYKSKGKKRIEIAEVATINELGNPSGHPPKRPLWAASMKEMGGVKGFRDIITKSLYTNLINKGYNVTYE